jgi:hypothetical protein
VDPFCLLPPDLGMSVPETLGCLSFNYSHQRNHFYYFVFWNNRVFLGIVGYFKQQYNVCTVPGLLGFIFCPLTGKV